MEAMKMEMVLLHHLCLFARIIGEQKEIYLLRTRTESRVRVAAAYEQTNVTRQLPVRLTKLFAEYTHPNPRIQCLGIRK